MNDVLARQFLEQVIKVRTEEYPEHDEEEWDFSSWLEEITDIITDATAARSEGEALINIAAAVLAAYEAFIRDTTEEEIDTGDIK